MSTKSASGEIIVDTCREDLWKVERDLSMDSRWAPGCGAHRLPSMKGAPPPATPCGAQVPFRLCLRQSPGTAPVRWCGLRFALPTARLATPRLLPGACRTNRVASGRVGEPPWLSDPPVLQPPTSVMGGGGAPKHFQSLQTFHSHIDHSLEPPEIVYSGGDSPKRWNCVGGIMVCINQI